MRSYVTKKVKKKKFKQEYLRILLTRDKYSKRERFSSKNCLIFLFSLSFKKYFILNSKIYMEKQRKSRFTYGVRYFLNQIEIEKNEIYFFNLMFQQCADQKKKLS